VLTPENPGARDLTARSAKAMHVSPFQPMALEYQWRLGPPAARLGVHMTLQPIESTAAGTPFFDATLNLERRPIRAATLAATLLRFPFMTLGVFVGIHWQALRLWLKRIPVHAHPGQRRETTG
jgi:DUF1365 family protein